MIWSDRRVTGRARLRAVRNLFRTFTGENRPEARARRLLREWLSDEQCRQFDRHGHFDVVGCDTGRRYRIHYGVSANILELNETGGAATGWCVIPTGFLAPGDVMLAQKIALETDETAALAVANRTPAAPTVASLIGPPF